MDPVFPGTEQLVLCDDRPSGLRAIIAIDDTTLGPGLGGVRMKAYRPTPPRCSKPAGSGPR